MKTLFLVLGRSGTGKSSVVGDDLCVCSRTNRPPKPHEQTKLDKGLPVDHLFVDDTVYKADKANGNVVAETEIGGVRYWATTEDLDKADVYVIDPRGEKEIRENFSDKYNFVSVYIDVDPDIRAKRLAARGDNPEALATRLAGEEEQFSAYERKQRYDYILQNNYSLQEAKDEWNHIKHEVINK